MHPVMTSVLEKAKETCNRGDLDDYATGIYYGMARCIAVVDPSAQNKKDADIVCGAIARMRAEQKTKMAML